MFQEDFRPIPRSISDRAESADGHYAKQWGQSAFEVSPMLPLRDSNDDTGIDLKMPTPKKKGHSRQNSLEGHMMDVLTLTKAVAESPADSTTSSETTDSDEEEPGESTVHCEVKYPSMPGSLKFPSQTGKPNRLVLVMVGLPARGKTFISRKICRYVTWLGHNCKVFNVGQYRRVQDGERGTGYQGADFFDKNNPEAAKQRKGAAVLALEEMISWLMGEGQVAIFDATNTTWERRQWVLNECHSRQFQVLFVESLCNDPSIIENNVHKHKIKSADYVGMDPEVSVHC